MKTIKKLLFSSLVALATMATVSAKENNPSGNLLAPGTTTGAALRACARPTAQRDLSVNNVRARLLNGGDMWWDLNKGKYVVPKPAPGEQEKSSMFAGSVWIGGYDGANLKVAAQTYRQNGNDFWPGPLNPATGSTTAGVCSNWDKFFEVSGTNIKNFVDAFYADANGDGISDGLQGAQVPITDDLKKWPAQGNTDFINFYGFALPNQTLAPFFDRSLDGEYDPADGDFPIIEVRGCDASTSQKAQFADQMIWWVYNDEGAGGVHSESKGATIRMEVQALAFAYQTDNQINDMTFYRFKLLNRASTTLDSTHISLWSDPDLGCYNDDYIGSKNDLTNTKTILTPNTSGGTDTTYEYTYRSLGYVYNADPNDDVVCPNGGSTGYGEHIPILGVDYFRGARDENGKDLGMSSFLYYINNTAPAPPPCMSNPGQAQEFFNYMSGSWRCGERFTVGGEAYDLTSNNYTNFVFPDDPNNSSGWSMAALNATPRDYRFIQTSGPFKLIPGATNEVIAGLVWVPDQNYPKPPLNDLLAADDVAQNLFDNCFDILDGPDAPLLKVTELDKELVITLEAKGNNVVEGIGEAYIEKDPGIPATAPLNLYQFEGYRVYQVANSEVSVQDLQDGTKAREIFQVDVKNKITTAINWTKSEVVPGQYIPEFKVIGQNKGISHSLRVTKDEFAQVSTTNLGGLVNHRKYYFVAVSYAYNKYAAFNEITRTGQSKEYLQGRKTSNVIGIPRRPAAEILGAQLNAVYGDHPAITRLDGKGTNGEFLDLSDETAKALEGANPSAVLTYKPGYGPISVKVIDPYLVKGGKYTVLVGRDRQNSINVTPATGTTVIPGETYWVLKDDANANKTWISAKNLNANNDQVIPDLGVSVRIGQPYTVGDLNVIDAENGYVGSGISYKDNSLQWFGGVKDGTVLSQGIPVEVTNYIKTANLEPDQTFDPKEVYSKVLNGWFAPFKLCDCRAPGAVPYLSPGWTMASPATLCNTYTQNTTTAKTRFANLNNVDIIMTPDKNLWSRCVVVETSAKVHADAGLINQSIGTVPKQFDLRGHLSVDKNGLQLGDNGYNAAEVDPATPEGYGWFPGYAVDVETGKRLNIFFGEASVYDGTQVAPGFRGDISTGADMLFNPSKDLFVGDQINDLSNIGLGGMHNIYVTNQPYDSCKNYKVNNLGTALKKSNFFKTFMTWTSIVVPKIPMKSVQQGLIPTETRIKLRVARAYETALGTNSNNTYPQYGFSLDKFAPSIPNTTTANEALQEINVVPNPYYAYSLDELRELDNVVRFTNLPAKCDVTVYSLDGNVIRSFKRDEQEGSRPGSRQIESYLEWDLKTNKNILISSGVYLIHVNAPGIGERTIKWFGIMRALDAQRL